jgi:hypothetical protein
MPQWFLAIGHGRFPSHLFTSLSTITALHNEGMTFTCEWGGSILKADLTYPGPENLARKILYFKNR